MTWCAPMCLYTLQLALMGVVWPAQASAAADALGEVPTQEPSRPSPKPGMKKASKPAKKGGDVKRKSMTAQMLSADMAAALADDLLSADSIQEEGDESSAAEVRPLSCNTSAARFSFPHRSHLLLLLRGAAA